MKYHSKSARFARSSMHRAIRQAIYLSTTSALIAGSLFANLQAGELDEILLNSQVLDTASADAQRLSVAPMATGNHLRLVQFYGPVKSNEYAALSMTGVRVVDYVPNNAYLVYGDAAAISSLQSLVQADTLQFEGTFPAELKISNLAAQYHEKGVEADFYSIQLVLDPQANAQTLAMISGLVPTGQTFDHYSFRHYVNISAKVNYAQLLQIAQRGDVISIQPDFSPDMYDERQTRIMSNQLTGGNPNLPIAGDYLAWLGTLGFTQSQFDTSAFTIDISDQGLDNGTTLPMHFGLFVGGAPSDPSNPTNSRVVYNKAEGSAVAPADLTGCGGIGHGGWVSHVAASNTSSVTRDAPHGDGYHFGTGVSPFSRIGSSIYFTPGGSFTTPNFPNSFSRAYSNLGTNAQGARISNHSWGQSVGTGIYNANSQSYDALVRDAQPTGSSHPLAGNQQLVTVVAAGNSGPGVTTMGAPSTAKNVFTAGGSQNVRPGVSDAVNADAMYSSSSRGPTTDGRIKPDILAPATNITGGVVMNDRLTTAPGNFNTCYTGPFIGASRYYRTGNGTSFSSPAISGASALTRQWFINQGGEFANTPPSPAMNKAYLMNAATYLATLTDNLPSNNQGMGRVNLERAFDNTPRSLRDQVPADAFTSTGQLRSYRGTISDITKPFRVTVAYSDAPGSTTGNAYVNNLDLRVTAGGQTYLGNVFSTANSVTGGSADVRNNVESVFLPAGVSGNYSVVINASNIAGQADTLITGNNQDFALVSYNSTPLIPCTAQSITPNTLPSNVVAGTVYPSTSFATTGTGPFSYSASGTLPPGLTLSSAGVLSGIPTTGGTFNFGVSSSESNGCVSGQPYSIIVNSANLQRGATTITTSNSIIEPNECNAMNIVMNNTGNLGATAISTTLSSSTPGVTIAADSSNYADMPATTGTGSNATPFQISTAASVTCGTTIDFTQTVNFSGGFSPTAFNFSLPVGQQGGNYVFTSAPTGASIPAGGTLVVGSAADDAVVDITVPAGFAFSVYANAIAGGSVLRASTNGNIQFQPTGGATAFSNTALPGTAFTINTPVVMALWDDLNLNTPDAGIYTQLVGTAPNRRWVVEWRGKHFGDPAGTQTLNMAAIFRENSPNYEVHYAQVDIADSNAGGASATIGLQASNTGTVFTQYSFNTASSVATGQVITATLPAPICSTGAGICIADTLFQNGFEQ